MPVEFESSAFRDCLADYRDPAGTSLADTCSKRWPDCGFGRVIFGGQGAPAESQKGTPGHRTFQSQTGVHRNAGARRLGAAAGHQTVRLMDERGGWSITSPGLGDYGYPDYYYALDYIPAMKAYMSALQIDPHYSYALNGLALSNGAVKTQCTRIHEGPKAGGVAVITKTWTCDAPTTALVHQADSLVAGGSP